MVSHADSIPASRDPFLTLGTRNVLWALRHYFLLGPLGRLGISCDYPIIEQSELCAE
jgi:hypothetical protein